MVTAKEAVKENGLEITVRYLDYIRLDTLVKNTHLLYHALCVGALLTQS